MSLTNCGKLRNEVKELKAERRDIIRVRKARKAMEDQLLLEWQTDMMQRLKEKDEEISRLKRHLAESTQREQNTRTRFEKEKKALQKKLDRLESAKEEDRKQFEEDICQKNSEVEIEIKKERERINSKLEAYEASIKVKQSRLEKLFLNKTTDLVNAFDKGYRHCLEVVNNGMSFLEISEQSMHTTALSIDQHFKDLFGSTDKERAQFQKIRSEVSALQNEIEKESIKNQHWIMRHQQLEKEKDHLFELQQLQQKQTQQQFEQQMNKTADDYNRELDHIQQCVKDTLADKDSTIHNLEAKIRNLELNIEKTDSRIAALDISLLEEQLQFN